MRELESTLSISPKDLADLLGVTVQGLYKSFKDHDIATVRTGRAHRLAPQTVRKCIELRGGKYPRKKIAVHIIKGGVGKTTLTHGLAARASSLGFKTLMVDLDQQANLTQSFNINSADRSVKSLIDVIGTSTADGEPKIKIKDVVKPLTDFLHILPATLNLANLELILINSNKNISQLFKNIFKDIEGQYDLIFFDCPPALSRITFAATAYSDTILLPVNADGFSIEGLELTSRHIKSMAKEYDLKPECRIILNKLDSRQTVLLTPIISHLREKYQKEFMDSYITVSKSIDNSLAEKKCVWDSNKKQNIALEDMHNALVEILGLKTWSAKNAKGK